MTRTPRKMVLLFAKVGEELEEEQVEGGGKSGLGVGPIKFELPVIHTNGEGK